VQRRPAFGNSIRVEFHDDTLQVVVADNGDGMSQAEVAGKAIQCGVQCALEASENRTPDTASAASTLVRDAHYFFAPAVVECLQFEVTERVGPTSEFEKREDGAPRKVRVAALERRKRELEGFGLGLIHCGPVRIYEFRRQHVASLAVLVSEG
jgi:hypothetical protein